jgi:hypothetical protein
MDVTEEEWLTTGQAAKIAARDIRTIRRWIDTAQLKARISPGGHRQVALSSLLAIQQPAGDRRRRTRRGGPLITPLDCLADWADLTLDWSGWKPPAATTRRDLDALIDHIDDVRRSLDDARATALEAALQPTAAGEGSEILDWLKDLPTTRPRTSDTA